MVLLISFMVVVMPKSISSFVPGTVVQTKSGHDYVLTEPVGTNYHPEFNPVYTPIEMLAMGVFEGKYINDCTEEYPIEFFSKAKLSNKASELVNYFGIKSRSPLSEWKANGWINPQDPRGWFEWYCRYYLGRRTEDDLRQIKRWKSFARHAGQIKKNCPGELTKRTRQRQALLQWSYDPHI